MTNTFSSFFEWFADNLNQARISEKEDYKYVVIHFKEYDVFFMVYDKNTNLKKCLNKVIKSE